MRNRSGRLLVALAAASMLALAACGAGVDADAGISAAQVPPSPFLVPTSPGVVPGVGSGPLGAAVAPVQVAPARVAPVKVVASSTRAVIVKGPQPKGRKVIYLTYDDGPSKYTPELLKILKAYNAKATFFVIGGQVGSRPATVRRTVAAGHLVANHSWNHPNLTRLSSAAIKSQLTRTNRAVLKAGVKRPTCMRPPYGSQNATVRKVADSQHLRVVIWGIDTRDWSRPGTSTIAKRVINGARNGSIVLMHDGGGNRAQTLAATRTILRTLSKKGYTFAPLPVCR